MQYTSLSFEAAKADLIAYVQSKPEKGAWIDFLDSSIGTTFIELAAGVSAFQSFHDLVTRREGYLQTAQFRTSVEELAFNRGLMLAPSLAGTITVNMTPVTSFNVAIGDVVGTYDSHTLIAYENKSFSAAVPDDLLCVVGNINTITKSVAGVAPFQEFDFTLEDAYAASQLELLTIDGLVVPLVAELNYLTDYGSDFVLRRISGDKIKIYSGNGTIGYTNASASTMVYRCISYGVVAPDGNAALLVDAALTRYTITTSPAYYMPTEDIRGMALYYPLDGRIVQDRDYEAVILKYYGGGVVLDIYSYNTNPDQVINILVDTSLPAGALAGIKALVDLKRGQGILVTYNIDLLAAGQDLSLSFNIAAQHYSTANLAIIIAYIESLYKYKYMKANVDVSPVQIAIDIQAMYGIIIYPTSYVSVSYTAGEYIKSVTLTITSV